MVYIDDIPKYLRYEYEQECSCCSRIIKVLTQDNDFAEYETEVYVQCNCGEYAEFILPVN